MPKVSEFYGIRVYFYFEDHAPHTFTRFMGAQRPKFPSKRWQSCVANCRREPMLVVEWARYHRDDLMRAWRQASLPEAIDPIAPLP